MKYWGFYASEELKSQTIGCAKSANESDSEYIRKAVEQRNAQYGNVKSMPKQFASPDEIYEEHKAARTKPTIEDVAEKAVKKIDVSAEKPKPSIQELKEKVKEMEKPQQVQTFMKGGK